MDLEVGNIVEDQKEIWSFTDFQLLSGLPFELQTFFVFLVGKIVGDFSILRALLKVAVLDISA